MHEMDRAYRASDESARRLAEERARMKEAEALVRYGHSRSGLLAAFLRRMAVQNAQWAAGAAGALRRGRAGTRARRDASHGG